jgi:hypothetical protein
MSENQEVQPTNQGVDLHQKKARLMAELASFLAEAQHKVGQIVLVEQLLAELNSPPPRS